MCTVRVVERRVELSDIDWAEVVGQLTSRGWTRLRAAVAPEALGALEGMAPGPWFACPETEGRCRGSPIDSAAVAGVTTLPVFNHAEWCRADRGQKFITPHRDPVTAGGVIAVLTIQGRAVFRVWDSDGSLADARCHSERATAWETEDGDLVLLRGGGWPLPTSRCPIHEAESPLEGDRVTLTLRHNTGGYGADYFA